MGLHSTAQYFWLEACSFMSVFTLLKHDLEVDMEHAGILEFSLVDSSRSAPPSLFMLYLIQVLRAPLGSWFPGEDVDVFRGDTWEGKKTGLVIPWLGLLGEEEAAHGQASGDREGQALSHWPP